MASSELYTLSSVVPGSGLAIGGIQSQNLDPGLSDFINTSDGMVSPMYAGIHEARYGIGFSTTNLADAMTELTVDGALWTSSVFSFKRYAKAGTRESSNAIVLTAATAFAYPVSISASQGSLATLEARVIPYSSSGFTCPIVKTSGTPNSDVGVTECFTIGKLKVGSTIHTGFDSMTCNFGNVEVMDIKDGETYVTFAGLEAHAPRFICTTTDLSLYDTYKEGVSGAAVLYFRLKAKAGCSVADGTTGHATITFASAMTIARQANASMGGSGRFVIETVAQQTDATGTPAIVAWSTGTIA